MTRRREGSFDERTRYLSEVVGEGRLTMGVEVNQPYAQIQHENTEYNHPNGQSHYLGAPLLENAFGLMEKLAQGVLTESGSNLDGAAEDVADEMAGYVEKFAPKDTTLLSESASPYVKDGPIETYRRPPRAPRRIGPSESGWHRS